MAKLWGRPVVAVVLVSGVALVLWPILGSTKALLAYAAGLLLLLLHHLANLSRLHRWLKEPRAETLPEGGAEWEEVYAAIRASQPAGLAMLAAFLQRYPHDTVARYHASQLRELVRAASA